MCRAQESWAPRPSCVWDNHFMCSGTAHTHPCYAQIIWRIAHTAHAKHGHHGGTGPHSTHRQQPDIQWSRYTWRRGSVPLWWGVVIKNQSQHTFKGSRRWGHNAGWAGLDRPWEADVVRAAVRVHVLVSTDDTLVPYQ
jgi:hypothetical protein